MKKTFLLAGLLILSFALPAQTPTYLDDTKPIEERIEDALSRMTMDEKVAMCHAQSKFGSAGVPRLGIPENWMTDGPHGIRPEVLWDEWNQAGWTNDSCIAFPALTCLAATWNREMSALYGKSIGEEARYRNKNVLLGPGVNIYRTPLNGRNFEYMGEDPHLAAELVVPYIRGVQSNGVAACVKHFALNNQEVDRHTVDVNLSDRALYEIYLPAFKAAVRQGNAWAIMGAYNLYRGQHACHNRRLLNDILRDEWQFDGVVVSDWGGVYDTRQAAYNGLDMEFGTGTNGLTENSANAYDAYFLAKPYLDKLQSGEIATATLDAKVRNILRLTFRTTMNKNRPFGSFGTSEHAQAGRTIAQEGIVLLQNDNNTLPIDPNKTKKIAVIGENAIRMMTVGGGSSSLKAKYEISPLKGLQDRLGAQVEVRYARGYTGEISDGYNGVSTKQHIRDRRSADELTAEAIKVAREADFVIFFGGLNKEKHQDCEGDDRKQLGLPYNQDSLITALAKVNKNIAVVIISGNAVSMPWRKEVPAILQGWYLGTEAGNALAAVLTGDINPSGKLPFTFGEKLTDYGAHATGSYPGQGEVTYKEDIFVGYRWFEKHKIKPLFAFGHGLSYTTFSYGKAVVSAKTMTRDDTITVHIPVRNTGNRVGKEVVQLYIGDIKSSVPRPEKELKGFEKIELQAGEEKLIGFTIDKEDLSFFDEEKHAYIAESGKFKIFIGSSSSDIRSTVDIELK
ncbi:MAG: glycoside hydrolase family 3 C-terminal domain-containing protein [Prevotellaceae bacterium]|jgi:beta-glucosidase|nr:glycoside hydrolase family 3 C-terminal domain-containing protein [Prevotellaceae bacterium]